MRGLLLLAACLLACSSAVSSSGTDGHYKGGSITWTANEHNPRQIEVFIRMNFKHDYSNGYLHEACTDEAIDERSVLSTEGLFKVNGTRQSWAKYICTDYDTSMDWSAGYNIMQYELPPGQTKAEINFEECCWPTNVANNGNDQGSGRGFNMASTIDISPRPDTGLPNSPPVVAAFPVYKLYRGCKYTRYIRAWDADGDLTRCRWTDANRNECNQYNRDICGDMYVNSQRTKRGAIIDEETCKVTFPRWNPVGTYAMAVMIEDFAPSDPSRPLSRVPVQFLIEVVDRDGRCRKPQLLGEDGTCLTIPTNRETQLPLLARSSAPGHAITSFKTIKPSGVRASSVWRVDGTTDEYATTLSWAPTEDQIGRHVICYEAEESNKYISDMFCIYVNVVAEADLGPPLSIEPHESSPAPGTSLIGNTIRITYNREIQRSSMPAKISILDASNNPVYQIESSSPDVFVAERTLSFDLPYDLPLRRGGVYKVRVDDGAVRSAVACEAAPEGGEWVFVFESFCQGNAAEPLAVSPAESVPAPGAEMSGNVVTLTYNKKIRKPTESAFVTIYSAQNAHLLRIDTSSDEATVKGRRLSFAVPQTLPMEFQGVYSLRVDEGAVLSAVECDRSLPATSQWSFVFVTFCDGDEAYEPLVILRDESVPAPGQQFAGQTMTIRYNKEIQKPDESAYITIYDAADVPVLRVDTSTPEATVEGASLSFFLSVDLPLQFAGGYRLRVDEGVVRAARQCDAVPAPADQWEFGFVTFCEDGGDYRPLSALPMESSPYPGENFAGRVVQIGYNKPIRKPFRSAYISILDSDDSIIHQVDASSSEATIVDSRSLRFELPLTLGLAFQGVYKVRVDGWAALSARDCDVSRPDTSEWRFTFLTHCEHAGSGFQPLAVLPLQSQPRPGGNISGNEVVIQYNKQIQRPAEPAFVTVLNSEESAIYRVDTTSDDVTIRGSDLTFSLPDAAPVLFGSDYRVIVDAGAARSAEPCDVAPPAMADWRFKWTGRRLPANVAQQPQYGSQALGNADCRESFMQTFVAKSLVGGDIDPASMYLNDHSCTGRHYNQTHYVIGTSYDACQTVPKATERGDLISFENVVYIPPQPYTSGSEITRDHFIEIHLTCLVPLDKLNHVSFDPNVTTIVYHERGYGNFNFSLRMYPDEGYGASYRPRDFPVGVQLDEPMNFEGRVTCDRDCDLMIDSCWATPTSNPFDATRFPFITNGCPIDDTVRILPSPSSKRERFAINSFAFLGENIHGTVFVHCDMRICDPSDPNSRCSMGCDESDQSATGPAAGDNEVLPPATGSGPPRSDVPVGEGSRRGKREAGGLGSPSSAAYASTGGQLRIGGDRLGVQSEQSQLAFNPDVVEISMLGVIILLLVVVVIMQCRAGETAGKASEMEV